MPAKGEPLAIRDLDDSTADPKLRALVRRLSEAKTPETIAQLAIWHVGSDLDWSTLASISRRWANDREIALAKQIADGLVAPPSDEAQGTLFITIDGDDATRATALRSTIRSQSFLGLTIREGIPASPDRPSISLRVTLSGKQATGRVEVSDPRNSSWISAGKFTSSTVVEGSEIATDRLAESLAEGTLDRLVRVELVERAKGKGGDPYRIRIENASPFVLHGLSLSGMSDEDAKASTAQGISLPPGKAFVLGASPEMVKRLSLKGGVRLRAALLSSL